MSIELNAGSGGALYASHTEGTDEVGISKLMYGGEGSGVVVAAATPLPVTSRTPNGDSVCDDTLDTVKVSQATAANFNATVVGTGTFAVQAAQSGTWNVTNISGTVSLPTGAATAAKQPALGTAGTASSDVITVQGIASMTPLLATVTFASAQAVTQSGTWNITNISGTISLPTGAATAAKQPALGTAGTASSDVITVQGIASMTPLLATVTFASAQAVTQSGTWDIGTVTTISTVTTVSTLTTITNAVKSVGNTAHDAALSDAPVAIGGFAKTAAPTAVSADGDAVRAWFSTIGSMFVTLTSASGQQVGATATGGLVTGGNWEVLDDDAFAVGSNTVSMAGFFADETATGSVSEGDAGAARMTLDRKIIITTQPHTAGGLTMHKTVSAASTNATSVKAAAGKLYTIAVSSVNAAVRYLKLYNKASAPTVGTDTPVWTLPIPGATAGGGLVLSIEQGLEFTTGIAFALTTEATDAGSTGVSANEHVVNLGYK